MAEPTALDSLPTTAICYALGLCVAGRQHPQHAGRVSALIAELKRRGEYEPMCAVLDHNLVATLILAERLDRGRSWAHNRRRPAG